MLIIPTMGSRYAHGGDDMKKGACVNCLRKDVGIMSKGLCGSCYANRTDDAGLLRLREKYGVVNVPPETKKAELKVVVPPSATMDDLVEIAKICSRIAAEAVELARELRG